MSFFEEKEKKFGENLDVKNSEKSYKAFPNYGVGAKEPNISIKQFIRQCNQRGYNNVLVVGPGTGDVTVKPFLESQGTKVTFIEKQQEVFEKLNEMLANKYKGRYKSIRGDIREEILKLNDGKFDVACCVRCLQFISGRDFYYVMKHMAQLAKVVLLVLPTVHIDTVQKFNDGKDYKRFMEIDSSDQVTCGWTYKGNYKDLYDFEEAKMLQKRVPSNIYLHTSNSLFKFLGLLREVKNNGRHFYNVVDIVSKNDPVFFKTFPFLLDYNSKGPNGTGGQGMMFAVLCRNDHQFEFNFEDYKHRYDIPEELCATERNAQKRISNKK